MAAREMHRGAHFRVLLRELPKEPAVPIECRTPGQKLEDLVGRETAQRDVIEAVEERLVDPLQRVKPAN